MICQVDLDIDEEDFIINEVSTMEEDPIEIESSSIQI